MKMKIKKLFPIFSLVLIPGIAFGAVIDCPYLGGGKNLLNYPNEVQPTSTDMGWKIEKEIEKLIKNLVHFIKECLVKPALVAIIIWGGIYIMISTGDPEKVATGKKIILAGIIGLIIIYGADAVRDFFSNYIR
jgi:hypothetical protein